MAKIKNESKKRKGILKKEEKKIPPMKERQK
jgi:hypothetical protein